MEIMNKSIGVVGASNNPEKYGYKVVKALQNVTNKIFPINPKESEILKIKAYSSPQEIETKLDIIVFVTPPAITYELLEKNLKKANFFRFQPGSFDEKIIKFCKDKNIGFENEKCIIVESLRIFESSP